MNYKKWLIFAVLIILLVFFIFYIMVSRSGTEEVPIEELEELVSSDTDNDGIKDIFDNCPYVYNFDQNDANKDGYGDVCQP
jgi:hypothetical protein